MSQSIDSRAMKPSSMSRTALPTARPRKTSSGGTVLIFICASHRFAKPQCKFTQVNRSSGYICSERKKSAAPKARCRRIFGAPCALKLRRQGGPQIRSGVMSIPQDLQRKCEQRWRARLARPAPSVAPQSHRLESQNEKMTAPAKTKKEAGQAQTAGSGVRRSHD